MVKWLVEEIRRDVEMYAFKRGCDVTLIGDIRLDQADLRPYIARAIRQRDRALHLLKGLISEELHFDIIGEVDREVASLEGSCDAYVNNVR